MTATMPMDKLCSKMRCLVHDCLAKHLYDSAIFYADKLVTMSRSADADVYTLAEVANLHTLLGVLDVRSASALDSRICWGKCRRTSWASNTAGDWLCSVTLTSSIAISRPGEAGVPMCMRLSNGRYCPLLRSSHACV